MTDSTLTVAALVDRAAEAAGLTKKGAAVLVGLLCLLLLWAVPVNAQHRCGGHTIHWIGGTPRASLDADRGPKHGPPERQEPDGMTARDRELWDALVFNAYDYPTASQDREPNQSPGIPLEERHTIVMGRGDATSFRICMESPDDSYTGDRLDRYNDRGWWREQIQRFTNSQWSGDIETDACWPDDFDIASAPNGWVYIREGADGEVRDDWLASATSWRYYDPHGVLGTWARSEIVWHSADKVRNTGEDWFESSLAHEFGHVLGLSHVDPSSGFVMLHGGAQRTWPDKERWLAQWAHNLGPGVQYPGFVRQTAPEPGDLKGGVKDLADEALDELNDDSNGRQAAESVPALPAAGVLLLATLLGLLGRRHLRTG